MKKVSITEAKNKLSALIDGLRGGSPVLIVDRGRPVARLEPVTDGPDAEHGGRLSRLVRDGIVRPRRAAAARDPDMLVWWGSEVECVSALARLERNAMLDSQAAVLAFNRPQATCGRLA
jgi:prevent-host-death family protein